MGQHHDVTTNKYSYDYNGSYVCTYVRKYVYSNNFIEKKTFEDALLCNHDLCGSISYNVNLLCTHMYVYTYVYDWYYSTSYTQL